jgi:NTE family protein
LFSLPPLLGNKVYFTSAYELGKAYSAPGGSSKLPHDIAVAVVAETFLGPLGVGGSVGDTGHHKWYFQLGRFF